LIHPKKAEMSSTTRANTFAILAVSPIGNSSPLRLENEQYQVSVDKSSGIVSDLNSQDDEEHITRLVGTVVTVSVETVGCSAFERQGKTVYPGCIWRRHPSW
jgi:hypothetical protein